MGAENVNLEPKSEFTNYQDTKVSRFGQSRKISSKKDKKESATVSAANSVREPLLPYDFNSKLYLEINTDVAEAGIEAAVHYVYQGIAEGRAYRYPEGYDANLTDKDTTL